MKKKKQTNKQTKTKNIIEKTFSTTLVWCAPSWRQQKQTFVLLVFFTLQWKFLLAATVATTKGGHKGGV